MSMTINVCMPRRPAIITIDNASTAGFYTLSVGEHKCHVLGTFQEGGLEEIYPVFVCELEDGSIRNVYTQLVRFDHEREMEG